MSTLFDHERYARIGVPETVYCEGKHAQHLSDLLENLQQHAQHPVLFTRFAPAQFELIDRRLTQGLDYDPISHTAFLNGSFPDMEFGCVAIITAGTSDLNVAQESSRTLEYLGITNSLFADIGVAGLWRLQERIDEINSHDVVIVVAGMDAALASVLAGLSSKPVVGVPTSVGYGVANGGQTALNAMLVSCASGLSVVNIDNGYGAACAALRILRLAQQE